MPKISSEEPAKRRPRLPPPCNGIEVNFCRNPRCVNFGRPDRYDLPAKKGRRSQGTVHLYTIVNAMADKGIRCNACNQFTRIRSNFGIAQEYFRIAKYLLPSFGPKCATPGCSNIYGIDEDPSLWRPHGRTPSGSQRYQCKVCSRTLSVGRSTLRHRKSHENREIFLALMNGMPIRRIMKVREIGAGTLYGKIDFLHAQCMKFAAERERQFEGMMFPHMRLATDKQDYHVNWVSRKERRPLRFSAFATAHLDSGYIFALNLTYDPDIDTATAQIQTMDFGEMTTQPEYRRHARLWLPSDHKAAQSNSAKLIEANVEGGTLGERIDRLYAAFEALGREEFVDWFENLPKKGAQVRKDYVAAAHFNLIAGMLHEAPGLTFYMDLDAELRSAVMSIFQARIRSGTTDVFYVKIAKEMSIDKKRAIVGRIKRHLDRVARMYPEKSPYEIRRMLIVRRIMRMERHGRYDDLWLKHPIPSMAEPDKQVSHLTNFGDRSNLEFAYEYDRASLHAVDRFFMQIRRGISFAERPISTANTGRRVWYGKHAYNPVMLMKLIEMYRIVFNYHELGADKQTPAMRLGLAKGRVKLEDIIYFQ